MRNFSIMSKLRENLSTRGCGYFEGAATVNSTAACNLGDHKLIIISVFPPPLLPRFLMPFQTTPPSSRPYRQTDYPDVLQVVIIYCYRTFENVTNLVFFYVDSVRVSYIAAILFSQGSHLTQYEALKSVPWLNLQQLKLAIVRLKNVIIYKIAKTCPPKIDLLSKI
jgi:hypothetical protein